MMEGRCEPRQQDEVDQDPGLGAPAQGLGHQGVGHLRKPPNVFLMCS
jgi:hypothetical protein